MSEFDAGTIIDGRYRVLHRLGAGGMADVYLAQDEQLDREVAVKLLHRRFAEDPGFVERFRREAQAAASLQHPNVVSVFDRGAFDGTYYIAMEYLEGRTLKRLIREDSPLEVNRAIDLTIQILKAARFAHRRGVIHRDLKPHNVIVDSSGHVKVTDFGIARAGASDMTETGSIMGTAQYLSPEQAQGHAVSAPSDLYSIAIVLYEMLTGRVPFDGESPVTIALKHVSEAPAPPSHFNPAIPSALEQVILWALNKEPADRPADAEQFITALEQVRESLNASPAEITASMRAVSAAEAGLAGAGAAFLAGETGIVAAGAYQPAAGLGSEDAGLYGGALVPPSNGDAVERYGEGQGDQRDSPIWPWLVGLLVVLALIGGGVAAYLLTRPAKALVPTVVGRSLPQAQNQLQLAGFTVGVINEPSSRPSQTVIAQNPLGLARVKSGSTVTLTVSNGPGDVNVPSIVQLPQAAAVRQLRHAGLRISRTILETSTSVPQGEATRTDPAGGASVGKGSSVVLYVSSGLAVPGVVGDNLGDAQNALSQFKVSTVPQTTTTVSPGTVLSQTPSAGQPVPNNGTVTLTVAQAPTTVKIPRVVGDAPAAAVATLTGANLTVDQVQTVVNNPANVGIVVKQSPGSNHVVKKGATVTITVGTAPPSNSGGGATSTFTTTTSTGATTSPATP